MSGLAFKADKSSSSEREVFSKAVATMYNDVAKLYTAKFGRKGVRQCKVWEKNLKTCDFETPEAKIDTLLLYYHVMVKAISGELPPTTPEDQEDEGPKTYDNLTLSQRRGKYLAEYCEQNKISSLKTSEARHILQTVEKVRLKPTVIIRALKEASKWVNSTLDHFGGRRENRLKIKFIKTSEFFNRKEGIDALRLSDYGT